MWNVRLGRRTQFLSLVVLLAVAVVTGASAATLEQETAVRIEQIRGIKAGQSTETIATYNQQMNAAWQFYLSHKPQILPVLRGQLKAEMAREQPSDLVLLDVGSFLHENDGTEGKALAREALFRLNTQSAVIGENHKGLFELAHAAAEDHDLRVLGLTDASFLKSDERIFIPQHALQLDGTLVCVFLYGAYGLDAEGHLRAKLSDPAVAKRVLEVLGWLGTPDSLHQVGGTLVDSPSYETLARVTSFMMQVAGPGGREFMLKVDPQGLEPKAREYLLKVRAAIQAASFDVIRDSFSGFPGDKKLPSGEVQSRLEAMIANDGKDDRTSPLAFLDSGVGSDTLISSLLKVRAHTLYRLSDEALSDVQVTNTLINGLRYRGH
jgi:hypothetical protein